MATGVFNGTIYQNVVPPVIKPEEPVVQTPEIYHPKVENADAPVLDKPHFYMMGHWKEQGAEIAVPEKPAMKKAEHKDAKKAPYNMYNKDHWKHFHDKQKPHNHPTVQADQDGDDAYHQADWPTMKPLRPAMFFFWVAAIVNICFLKFIEKSYAKLEFLQRTKILIKKTVKLQMAEEPMTAAPESAEVAYMPILKKVKVVDQEQPAQPVVVMPVAEKVVNVDDVESAPKDTPIFDYAIEDIPTIVTEPSVESSSIASQNSMM